MRPPLLVLVLWHGDIIAVHDGVTSGIAPVAACEGVSVEVYDVSAERAALHLAPPIDHRPIAGFLAAVALHVVVGAAALVAMRTHSDDRDPIQADDANKSGALVSDPLMRIAANENASEHPKDEHAPFAVDEEAAPAPPAEESPASEVAAHGSAGNDAVSTSPTVCKAPAAGAGSGPKCRRSVVITSLATRPGCFVDTVAKEGQKGTLTFPCEGDGAATLTFGKRAFAGAVASGKVDMCTGTEYPWNDGCTWTSAQRVSGSIASGTLQFTYGEGPKPGQGQCASACEATATVHVEGDSWRHSVK